MPYTYRDYPVMEAALSLFHGGRLASGHERATLGDIIEVRLPRGEIGTLERQVFLWLRIYGLDLGDMSQLKTPHFSNDELPERQFDKRMYSIPLARLKQVMPSFDMERARDPEDLYQPFFVLDETTGRFVANGQAPLPVQGLILDKRTRRYRC